MIMIIIITIIIIFFPTLLHKEGRNLEELDIFNLRANL